jgi:hypothetical protein
MGDVLKGVATQDRISGAMGIWSMSQVSAHGQGVRKTITAMYKLRAMVKKRVPSESTNAVTAGAHRLRGSRIRRVGIQF